ncbi:MAG: 4Fe-4S binding protein [Myxococcales bacterium]|nr:4Fe-4S binding protein [Myxococcales bacterium]MCB9628092.1 4Fe-4S binding protein [Sandaracinaceae bacterium]
MSRSLPLGRRDFLMARIRPVLAGRVEASSPDGSAVSPTVEEPPPPPWASAHPRVRRALPQLELRAQLDRFACLASSSQVCTVCVERCPEPGAITLDGFLPIIDEARCTGCGACEPACPAPTTAIRVLPRLPSLSSPTPSTRSA